MIRYALACAEGHDFEAWFANSDAYARQRAEAAIACPACGSTDVDKALMAPSLAAPRKERPMRVAANMPKDEEPLAVLRKLRKQMTENADYVGPKFAEEARRIHYEEVERRGIYGEATSEEARGLVEEGIAFHPLPVLPEDHN